MESKPFLNTLPPIPVRMAREVLMKVIESQFDEQYRDFVANPRPDHMLVNLVVSQLLPLGSRARNLHRDGRGLPTRVLYASASHARLRAVRSRSRARSPRRSAHQSVLARISH